MTRGSASTSSGVPCSTTRPSSSATIWSDSEVISGMSCSMISSAQPVARWMSRSSGPSASVSRWAMPRARLVEQQHLRVVRDRHAEVDDAARAGRQLGDELVAERAEAEQLDEVVDGEGDVLLATRAWRGVANSALTWSRTSMCRSSPSAMFSATVSTGRSGRPGTSGRGRRPARCSAPWRDTSRPCSAIRPPSCGRWPLIMSKIVVLPAPFGPISPRISSACTVKPTSVTAWMPPNRLVRPSTCSTGRLPGRAGAARARGPAPDRRRPVALAAHALARALQEHRAQDVVALEQLGGRAGEAHLALLHEEGLGGDRQRHVDRLLDQDDRAAAAVDLADDLEQLPDDRRGEPERELVDDEQLGLGDERHARARAAAARRRTCCRPSGRSARAAAGTCRARPRGGRRSRPGPPWRTARRRR